MTSDHMTYMWPSIFSSGTSGHCTTFSCTTTGSCTKRRKATKANWYKIVLPSSCFRALDCFSLLLGTAGAIKLGLKPMKGCKKRKPETLKQAEREAKEKVLVQREATQKAIDVMDATGGFSDSDKNCNNSWTWGSDAVSLSTSPQYDAAATTS